MNKPYPINGLEQDLIYAKKWYCYLQNNNKLVKWTKRQMNKRFRAQWKKELEGEFKRGLGLKQLIESIPEEDKLTKGLTLKEFEECIKTIKI